MTVLLDVEIALQNFRVFVFVEGVCVWEGKSFLEQGHKQNICLL